MANVNLLKYINEASLQWGCGPPVLGAGDATRVDWRRCFRFERQPLLPTRDAIARGLTPLSSPLSRAPSRQRPSLVSSCGLKKSAPKVRTRLWSSAAETFSCKWELREWERVVVVVGLAKPQSDVSIAEANDRLFARHDKSWCFWVCLDSTRVFHASQVCTNSRGRVAGHVTLNGCYPNIRGQQQRPPRQRTSEGGPCIDWSDQLPTISLLPMQIGGPKCWQ